MLVIRAEQLEQMAAARRGELTAKMERQLRTERPELFAQEGEMTPLELVQAAIDAAIQNEITGTRSLRLYVELALQYDLHADAVVRRIFANRIEPQLVRVRRARAWLEAAKGTLGAS
jgi:hypothetical protein